MSPETAYFIFGSTLVAALAAIWVFYYGRKRKDRVEAPKHRMLEDDDGP
jgi:cbb3-type cytochrome oxidase subunit 3